jgi:hypothetical protein
MSLFGISDATLEITSKLHNPLIMDVKLTVAFPIEDNKELIRT